MLANPLCCHFGQGQRMQFDRLRRWRVPAAPSRGFLAFPDFVAKCLQLLMETLPRLTHVAALWDPTIGSMQKTAIEQAAKSLDLALEILQVRSLADFDEAFATAAGQQAGALLMLSSPLVGSSTRT